ncbi:hypothetical protein D9758_012518 [Tetrapyrgos nigripes]|uniref:Phosducin domain-containing protein n=1 Tax=Tetrapyrgos nigripes TaxID=182062 RepID=A0A8H5G3A4_9AGAR|nr:hypothetical protein D9758_012518 [Tetrapyrgos nigripes]
MATLNCAFAFSLGLQPLQYDLPSNNALRAHGIIPPLENPPPSPSPPPSPTFSDILNDFTSEGRKIGEDTPDDETERMIAACRQQRIAEERASDKKTRFGRVYPIGRDDYTRGVTEASKMDEDGDEEEQGTAVVCFLYKDGIPRSDRAFEHVRTLASHYPRTKFVSIVGDKCILNLPDSRVPMFIVYKKGDICNQITAWGADRERRIGELEALLLVTGALHPPERRREEDKKKDDSEGEEDEEDYDRSSRMRSAATSVNGRTKKTSVTL